MTGARDAAGDRDSEGAGERHDWSLRRRVFGSLALAGLALTPVLLGILWGAATGVEDAVFTRRVKLESERLVEARRAAETTQPAPYFSAYWRRDDLPEPYRSWLEEGEGDTPQVALKAGVYEYEGAEAFVAVRPLDGTADVLYLVYDVRELEPLEGLEFSFYAGFGVVIAAVLLLTAMMLARRLDHLVLAPLRDLADAADRWDLDDWRERKLASDDRLDEIGQLTRSTRSATLRIRGFLQRERQFTRNASHELRSPLTVIKGATELLRARRSSDSDALPVGRIERATRRMESTIETFLWLAREDVDTPTVPLEVEPLVEDCLETLPRRLDRHHDIEIDVSPGLRLHLSSEALRIVLGNLLGNALRHGASGTVRLEIRGTRLAVTNPLSEPIEDVASLRRPYVGEGSGIGLAIVEDLCERHGWELSLEASADTLTVAVHLAKST